MLNQKEKNFEGYGKFNLVAKVFHQCEIQWPVPSWILNTPRPVVDYSGLSGQRHKTVRLSFAYCPCYLVVASGCSLLNPGVDHPENLPLFELEFRMKHFHQCEKQYRFLKRLAPHRHWRNILRPGCLLGFYSGQLRQVNQCVATCVVLHF